MPHTGVFTFLGNESNLDDGTDDFLLLKADVAEPNASKAAATTFLLDVKKFKQNQTITVQGNTSSLGTVPTILMTNASAGTAKAKKKKAKTAKAKKSSKKKAARKAAPKRSTKTKRRKAASKTARKKAKQ